MDAKLQPSTVVKKPMVGHVETDSDDDDEEDDDDDETTGIFLSTNKF